MYSEKELIKRCLIGEQKAYEQLYGQFGPKMLLVCSRYVSEKSEAQDLLQDGFVKVFQNLNKFKNEGSFEGWIRKIMVNLSLTYYHKNTNSQYHNTIDETFEGHLPSQESDIIENINADVLLTLVQQLPPAYKMVFNLYVFEGMKHREIAQELNIAEGTSKSNLQDARRFLQKKLMTINLEAKPYIQ